jgi:V-type H+-transporting ATPase 16kDa proteolipid subunit
MAVMRPELIMKSIVPVVMAGIIGIYGLVVSVLISSGLKQEYALYRYGPTAPSRGCEA